MSYQQQLRNYVDDGTDPIQLEQVQPSLDTYVAGHTSLRGRPLSSRVVLAAAAAAVVVGGFALMGRLGETPSNPTAIELTESPTTLVEVSELPTILEDWTKGNAAAFEPRSGAEIRISSLTQTSLGYFAVGAEVELANSRGALWRSPDGLDWERIENDRFGSLDEETGNFVPSGLSFDSITEKDGVLVLLGELAFDEVAPIVFRSSNGFDWVQTDLMAESDSPISLGGLVATSDSFVVVALDNLDPFTGDGNRLRAWTSTDGVVWIEQSTVDVPDGFSASDVEVVGDRVVIVGASGGHEGRAAVWVSDASALSWQEGSIDAGSPGQPVSAVEQVATSEDGIWAVGHQQSPGDIGTSQMEGGPVTVNGSMSALIWFSVDGLVWELQDSIPSEDSLILVDTIASGPAGLLVAATEITDGGERAIFGNLGPQVPLSFIDSPTEVRTVLAGMSLDDGYLLMTSSDLKMPLGGSTDGLDDKREGIQIWWLQ